MTKILHFLQEASVDRHLAIVVYDRYAITLTKLVEIDGLVLLLCASDEVLNVDRLAAY